MNDDFHDAARPGITPALIRALVEAQDMTVLGAFVRDIMRENMDARNFRIFAPDETASNRLQAVFEVTGRRFEGAQRTERRQAIGHDNN